MAKNWRDIRRSVSEESDRKIAAEVQAELAKLPLSEMRRAREMTQVRLAEVLRVDQGAISKLERRSDMYLSTLRSYVEALGGQLELRAVFPEGELMLSSLGETAPPEQPRKTASRERQSA